MLKKKKKKHPQTNKQRKLFRGNESLWKPWDSKMLWTYVIYTLESSYLGSGGFRIPEPFNVPSYFSCSEWTGWRMLQCCLAVTLQKWTKNFHLTLSSARGWVDHFSFLGELFILSDMQDRFPDKYVNVTHSERAMSLFSWSSLQMKYQRRTNIFKNWDTQVSSPVLHCFLVVKRGHLQQPGLCMELPRLFEADIQFTGNGGESDEREHVVTLSQQNITFP